MALIPLLWDIEHSAHLSWQARAKQYFKKGWVYGALFMGYFHLWILELRAWVPWYWLVLLWAAYAALLGVFYGGGLALYGALRHRVGLLVGIPAVWVVLEWLKGCGPFGNPAGALGYSQTPNLLALQVASLAGVYGITLVCVLSNVLLYRLLMRFFKQWPQPKKPWGTTTIRFNATLLFGLWACVALYGGYRLWSPVLKTDPIRVAVIQGNHPQSDKFDPLFWAQIRLDYLRLTEQVAINKPNWVFWPETITPSFNLEKPNFLRMLTTLCRDGNTKVVFGTPVRDNQVFYNGVAVAGSRGVLPEVYRKNRLMPFGEYIPFRPLLPQWVQAQLPPQDFSPATTLACLPLDDYRLGVGVCLESIYPDFYRTLAKDHADVLAVLVNNAWFFESSAAYEHKQLSVVRAVETNRYLIQAANTGISVVVHPRGRILREAQLDTRAILFATVYAAQPTTPYVLLGDWIVWLCMAALVLFQKRRFY